MTSALQGAAAGVAPEIAGAAPRAAAQELFRMRGVGKTFGDFAALSAVDISFAPGEIHCLLGENGAGKSTLCNLIFGIHRPTSGQMTLESAPYAPSGPRDALSQGVAMVHQHFSLAPELSVIDNLLLGRALGRVARTEEAGRIVALAQGYGLRLEPFRTVRDLAIGERQRIEIVKCLMREPRLLILDEPTAVLLPEEISALIETCRRVAEAGCAVVLVTHKLAEIKSAADRVSVLRSGSIVATSEDPAGEIDRLVGAMIRRDIGSMDSAMMSTLGLSAAAADAPRRRARAPGGSGEVMQADGLRLVEPGGAVRLDNVTFTVDRGEIVGIAGVEGNGQSELGRIIAGLQRPTEGHWYVGTRDMTRATPRQITDEGVGIVPEDRHTVAIATEMTLVENMLNNRMGSLARLGLVDRGAIKAQTRELMERFDVRATGPEARMGGLSGGNQQKAVLARELTTPNLKFLLAAQPTRGLDVGAVEAVYGLIRSACEKGAGVLLISSELDELIAVADRILVMYRGRIMAECPAHPDQRDWIGALMAGHE